MADPSKTEKPTGKRLRESRMKGSIAKSTEINTAFTLLAALLIFRASGNFYYRHLKSVFTYYFSNLHRTPLGMDDIGATLLKLIVNVLIMAAPFMLTFMLVGIAASLLQVGFLVTLEPIKFKLSKLNFISNVKNLFSKTTIENLIKSVTKVSVVGYLAYSTIRDETPVIYSLFFLPLEFSFFNIAQIAMKILTKIILAFVVVAAADYAFQRWSHIEKLKMTKQEVKDENKRTEGNPEIKGAIRRRQMEMARRRMMSEVPEADVVITNPFHVAVAIKYDATTMGAPIIVAKGLRMVAERIKEIAREHQIPLVENPPVARALYKSGQLGKAIPGELYNAVAEILTHIYRLTGKTFGI